MKILAVDIGTGTQDILLFDTEREVENNYKLVMPSPTRMVEQRIRAATRPGQNIVLSGVMMGGGPCAWAIEDHLRNGGQVFATPEAASTFNDDLSQVEKMGVNVVSEDEARLIAGADAVSLVMRDLDLAAIQAALAHFQVAFEVDLLAVAVFDHGNAPPGYSDRQFRFDYLKTQLSNQPSPHTGDTRSPATPGLLAARAQLSRLAFRDDAIPAALTRFQAVARSAGDFAGRMVFMDTAPAAVLGGLEDSRLQTPSSQIVANIGNFHSLAFRLGPEGIEGLFEHHTGELSRPKLEGYLKQLAQGELSHQAIFEDMGHGALMLTPTPRATELLAITGPRWGLLRGSTMNPYFAVPYGDMMMAGCYGLVRACAYVRPQAAEAIQARLGY